MSAKLESTQSDTIGGTAKEFVRYYENEIDRNVNYIYELIEQLQADSDNQPLLEEIECAVQAINDLAMVYGFEGVDVIASRMMGAIKEHKQKDISPGFLLRLQESTNAITEAMCLIDERQERELIRQWSRDTFPNEKLANVEIIETPSDSESEEFEEENDLVFDIKEDEKLISLLSDEDGGDYEIGAPLLSSDSNDNGNGDQFDNEIDSAKFDQVMTQPEELSLDFAESEEQDEQSQVEVEMSDSTLENDILALDFQRREQKKEKKEGLLGKIAHLFGSKSYQNNADVTEDILVKEN